MEFLESFITGQFSVLTNHTFDLGVVILSGLPGSSVSFSGSFVSRCLSGGLFYSGHTEVYLVI